MQQRLGLARVLIHDPQLLLLDEPASGLDPRARIEMMAILQELQRLGKTIIISSHILSELQTLCNRVAIIEKGRLIYSGPVQGVRDQMSQGRVVWVRVSSDQAQAIELLKARPEIAEVAAVDGEIKMTLADPDGRPQHRGRHARARRRQADRTARGRDRPGGSLPARDPGGDAVSGPPERVNQRLLLVIAAMTFLPIVERELRVLARRSSTVWIRFYAALGILLLWLLLLGGAHNTASSATGPTPVFSPSAFWPWASASWQGFS